MFIGHFALAYAAKRWAPTLSLGVLFAAATFADLLWPVLVAAGIEHVRIAPGITAFTPLEFISYPYSHSLLMLAVWGAMAAWVVSHSRRAFFIILLLVVSHWFLDVVTHLPDMPLYPGSREYGFALWNSIPLTMVVEAIMFAVGVSIYIRATRADDRIGRWGFIGVTAFLAAGFVLNAFAPPPPSVMSMCIAALMLGGLTVGLAHWVDTHRASATDRQ